MSKPVRGTMLRMLALLVLLGTAFCSGSSPGVADPRFAESGFFAIADPRVDYRGGGEVLGLTNARPRFSWKIVEQQSSGRNSSVTAMSRGVAQTHYHLELSTSKDFTSTLWSSGKVESSQQHLVPLHHGEWSGSHTPALLKSDTKYFWRVTSWLSERNNNNNNNSTAQFGSEARLPSFRTGLLSQGDWAAQWITGGMDNTLLRATYKHSSSSSGSSGPVASSVFVSGIGYFTLFVNGVKVGDHELDVGWTDYSKRVYYNTFDVTDLLVDGDNVFAVMLGNGWFSCGDASHPTSQPACSQSPPQLRLQLQTGGKSTFTTQVGPSASASAWKAGPSPITYNSLYNGEWYDARRELAVKGWMLPGFDDSEWALTTAASSAANNATMASALFEPIRRLSVRSPQSETVPKENIQVFDFGQNMAGLVNLKKFHCVAGQNITLRHAELLTHPPYGPVDGSIYVGNLRGAQATDIYTCRGDPAGESYSPRFTQHGFRFAEVSGLGYPLTWDSIEAVELHSDVAQQSSVMFSKPLLNDIQHAVVWGQKTNLMSVPTDCDQRDERRGWMGDAALTAEEASYNFEIGAMYSHWLDQIVDDQSSSGSVTNFVPDLGSTGPGAPNWQSAYPAVVWAMYKYMGDTGPVDKLFSSLEKYYDFSENTYDVTGIANFTTGFGDWVPPPPAVRADGHLVGAFAFLHDLKMGAEFFAASSNQPAGKTRAQHCAELFKKASAEFHTAFYDSAHGFYGSGMQTEQAMPLYLGIVPAALKPAVLQYTINDIEKTHTMHTTSGIIGIKCMLEALSQEGRSDVALSMALVDTYPSYGYMLQGEGNHEPATTIWELWDGDKEGPGMNSRNHIMFGTIGSWFYKSLAGITPAKPGFAAVNIVPSAVGSSNLTSSSALVGSPHGDIVSSWALESSRTCGQAAESNSLALSCADQSHKITAVTFAAFGTVTGSCGPSGFKRGTCDAKEAAQVVTKACVGKQSCTVEASSSTFGGDPCVGTVKSLAIEVSCAGESAGESRLVQQVQLPIGTTASLAVPILGRDVKTITITEAGASVWSNGKFTPGVPGVTAATAGTDCIMLAIGSGSFSFSSH